MYVVSVLSKIKNIIPELQRTLPNLTFHEVKNADEDKQFRESHIIVADYDLLAPYINDLPQAKWVQGTWAGIDPLLQKVNPVNPPKFAVSRFSGRHFGYMMSEYVISNIINLERSAFKMKNNQSSNQWIKDEDVEDYRAIYDLTIGILGLGNIGDRVARTLKYMGAVVYGFGRRTNFNLEDNRHITKYFTKNTLPEMLQSCDYVINIMPNTSDTKGMLNGDILKNCQDRQTVFVNVGRGTIISEESLVNVLQKKWISAAILDVFDEEPLRSDSVLWQMPNVVITPHVSAVSRAKDIAELTKDNFKYYEQNLPIPATIDFSKGY